MKVELARLEESQSQQPETTRRTTHIYHVYASDDEGDRTESESWHFHIHALSAQQAVDFVRTLRKANSDTDLGIVAIDASSDDHQPSGGFKLFTCVPVASERNTRRAS